MLDIISRLCYNYSYKWGPASQTPKRVLTISPERLEMIRKIFVLAFACLFALFGLTACSGSAPKPVPTVTVTVTAPAPTPTASPTPTVPESTTVTELNRGLRMEWVSDPNRKVLFQDFPKASVIVAKALLDGKFGTAYRYNEWKTDWVHGQTGWGGISANYGGDATSDKPGAFAWVYWNADGSVDWSKGVPDFGIDMGPKYFGLLYYSTDGFDENVKHSVSLDAATDNRDSVYVTCFNDCFPSDENGMMFTRDPSTLVRVETDAMKALNANMSALTKNANWGVRG